MDKAILDLALFVSRVEANKKKQAQEVHKKRLAERLKLFGFKEENVTQDGNCQFHAVALQISHHWPADQQASAPKLRETVGDWLRENAHWNGGGGSELHNFVDEEWGAYCTRMAKNGEWGDHVTLIALAETLNIGIRVISSIEGDQFIIEIDPSSKSRHNSLDRKRVFFLGHWSEFHYVSLIEEADTAIPNFKCSSCQKSVTVNSPSDAATMRKRKRENLDPFAEVRSKAILDSPFEATIVDSGMGALSQHSCQKTLQPSRQSGFVFFSCLANLDSPDGVSLIIRLREGFKFVGEVTVNGWLSWHDDEESVNEKDYVNLGVMSNKRPVLFTPVQPEKMGVEKKSGTHYYTIIRFDLTNGTAERDGNYSTVHEEIRAEKEAFERLTGKAIITRACRRITSSHSHNLEFVKEIANIRVSAVESAHLRNEKIDFDTACNWIEVDLLDKLTGEHFQTGRKVLSARLLHLRKMKGDRVEATSPSFQSSFTPTIGGLAKYKDAKGRERIVQVVGYCELSDYYKIKWNRHTVRSQLQHIDGKQVKAEECQSVAFVGKKLVYMRTQEDVTVQRIDFSAVDEEGVPQLEIEFIRKTDKLSPIE